MRAPLAPRAPRRPLSSRDWFGKTAAAFILGFTLALGCAGLFRIAAGVGDAYFSTKGQFAMWLMAPLWALTLSFCFLFRSSLRAWLTTRFQAAAASWNSPRQSWTLPFT